MHTWNADNILGHRAWFREAGLSSVTYGPTLANTDIGGTGWDQSVVHAVVFIVYTPHGFAQALLYLYPGQGKNHVVAMTLAFLYQLNIGFSPLLT